MKRILLVDDEPDFTALLKDTLEGSGDYLVATVNESSQALQMAREFEPHLIFLDVVMPGKDGGDLAGDLASDPKLKKVPIVMLTALVEENQRSPTGETVRGGLSFVSKTSGLPTLIACIEKHTEDV